MAVMDFWKASTYERHAAHLQHHLVLLYAESPKVAHIR